MWYKSRFKNMQDAERRIRKLPGSTDRETDSTDQNTSLQNFKFNPTAIQAQKGLEFQIYFFWYIKETLGTFYYDFEGALVRSKRFYAFLY